MGGAGGASRHLFTAALLAVALLAVALLLVALLLVALLVVAMMLVTLLVVEHESSTQHQTLASGLVLQSAYTCCE